MIELPVNLFDCLFVAVLLSGIVIGRRNGVSKELLRVLKWLALVVVCACTYGPIGALLAQTSLLDPYASNLVAYLGCATVIILAFSGLQKRLGRRVRESDVFGRTEYYLGMGSGMVRHGCILMAGLALLNARAFTPAELQARARFQEQNFGSTIFPTLHTLQVGVFERSLSGALIRNYLGFLLITPTPKETTPHAAPGPGRIAGR